MMNLSTYIKSIDRPAIAWEASFPKWVIVTHHKIHYLYKDHPKFRTFKNGSFMNCLEFTSGYGTNQTYFEELLQNILLIGICEDNRGDMVNIKPLWRKE